MKSPVLGVVCLFVPISFSTTSAAVTAFTNEADFLAATTTNIFESFEQYAETPPGTETSFDGDYFVVAATPLSGPNVPTVTISQNTAGGAHPTDGIQFLGTGAGGLTAWTLDFDMDSPVTAAGFWVTDFGDSGTAGTLSLFIPEIGEEVLIATGGAGSGLPNGNELFFGFITPVPISSFQLVKTTTSDGFGVDSMYFESATVPVPVRIDIKPGSDTNPINLRSRGVIPVAILTTDEFDATNVDPGMVQFAAAPPLRWIVEDVDNDGALDFLLFFDTQGTNIGCEDTQATLTGNTFDGVDIAGTDSLKTVGCTQ